MKDYYKILGVSPSSDIDTIKKRYIELLKKYHPDLYKGSKLVAEKKTAELNMMYDILKDKNKREAYNKSIGLICSVVDVSKKNNYNNTVNNAYENIKQQQQPKPSVQTNTINQHIKQNTNTFKQQQQKQTETDKNFIKEKKRLNHIICFVILLIVIFLVVMATC